MRGAIAGGRGRGDVTDAASGAHPKSTVAVPARRTSDRIGSCRAAVTRETIGQYRSSFQIQGPDHSGGGRISIGGGRCASWGLVIPGENRAGLVLRQAEYTFGVGITYRTERRSHPDALDQSASRRVLVQVNWSSGRTQCCRAVSHSINEQIAGS
ncbi:hypothetical protein SDC9_89592 [bioreactor metagenome]|uniref:Uncharacterized protein n=1 Tax=bioreactor metagenome TaxID=1076179 RepID=A0A644ZPP4_9ZZZZ